jgi:type IV pilus assembly protein PilA
MKKRNGFTLIELMVVVLVVAILAAVAIPIMRGNIDKAKWAEGIAGADTIRTSIRAYIAEHGSHHDYDELLGCH